MAFVVKSIPAGTSLLPPLSNPPKTVKEILKALGGKIDKYITIEKQ